MGAGLWSVLVGRFVEACRLNGLKFIESPSHYFHSLLMRRVEYEIFAVILVKGIMITAERIINGLRAGTMTSVRPYLYCQSHPFCSPLTIPPPSGFPAHSIPSSSSTPKIRLDVHQRRILSLPRDGHVRRTRPRRVGTVRDGIHDGHGRGAGPSLFLIPPRSLRMPT